MKIVFMSSNAVAQNRISEVVGYLLDKGNFNTSTENLPPIIAILGEANTANQSGLSTAPYQITSAQQAGAAYGYGSPIHSAARILFPLSGGGVSCPVIVYPQASSGAVANVQTITVTGTATGNGTVYVNVAGRSILDGASYAVNILTGDTPTAIGTKISNAINASLGAPTTAAPVAGVVTCTAKWTGLTTQDIKISVDTGVTATGCTFAIAQTVAGTGTPAVTTSLNMFGSQWNNIVLNTYGLVSATIGELETFNGGPDPINPTGRFSGITFKPLVALCGTLLDDPTTITGVSARKTQCTIVACPAPLSQGLSYEAAANVAVLLSNILASSPHLDVMNSDYPDMPMPLNGVVPAMTDYNVRDTYVKAGCSTVDVSAGVYKIKDLVTTYRPDGETPPQYRYVRDLFIDFNIEYGWKLRVKSKFVAHTLCDDNATVTADNIVKPKMVVAEGYSYAIELSNRALIADAKFMQQSMSAAINSTNPNRLDVNYSYQRTGMTRIVSTTAKAGFNFGNA